MTDRRATTSRANLGQHIPTPLAPEGTTTLAVRLPRSQAQRIRQAAKQAGLTTSEYLRRLITPGVES